ncbi:DNA polymerase III subunit gamma/tau [Anaerococcus sp. AGMB00486]|uniref:DNA-directed DNA polymerase n=1 Tax=Anaerococcus faecalis TaxID=2742993 RepID=A0ABX2N705_9FIRM|nr:DNA polymerase III subunit gamma/tau [Anaerococcus faecalis]NVF10471.1 DNA polymerase III subunit gamma/tau [Anaerococcus faecalis]
MAKALYREYRPQNFDNVLGQDRVVNVLKNQVKSSQISHAYLFAGERGCGKTTCAKIFAKAINCLNPRNGSPCGECENCKSIDEESTMDIVEMDAASNRRIDDIRSLKETVIYPPNNLRYKVYIIDEAHMITREAFNALLKIMEEPPSHLVFILATTEIDKIPKTILSRVQKFEFNKIGKTDIIKQIDTILRDKNISMDNEAKELVVAKASGAMRDALSILDQVLSINKKNFTLADVQSILGVVESKNIDLLLDKIIGLNQKGALDILFALRENNKDDMDILDSLTIYLRDIMIYKTSASEKHINSLDFLDNIKEKSEKISNNQIISYLEIINDYSNRMKNSFNTSLLMEMLLLRLINLKDEKNIESRIERLEKNNPSNNIDLINKIVEEKLADIDVLSIKTRQNNNFKINDESTERDDSLKKDINEEIKDNNLEVLSSKIEERNNEERILREDKTLSKKDEENIKKALKNNCSPLIRTFIDKEGLNYDIIKNKLVIYYESSFYYQSLEAAKDNIKSIIKTITGIDFNIDIENIDKKNYKKNNNIEESNNIKIDSENIVDKLEKVFGKDITIEE